ncbi:CHAT domain-containing protein [Aerosakkonemataceae cyanobacterium BLCC-F50]|uniref:CHAT domain-containing protein n=1 Tax=Floridaenema flaviceps BLCC-F50 TaxID=3153642 RepID=A0ABV4XK85_9CYAN
MVCINNPQISKAEALRNSQIAFLTKYPDADYNRPYHWAAFTLVGNWL